MHSCFCGTGTLLVVQFFLFGWVEGKRWMDYRKPGSQAEPGSFLGLEGAFKSQSNGYPGGIFFDPLGFSRYLHLVVLQALWPATTATGSCTVLYLHTFAMNVSVAWLNHSKVIKNTVGMFSRYVTHIDLQKIGTCGPLTCVTVQSCASDFS